MVLHLQFATQVFITPWPAWENTFKLDLSNESLPIIVVLEIQALVAARIMHILNFFVPNSGSSGRTHSDLIFSELNFHQQQLVELFVRGVLVDLIHQNRTSWDTPKQDLLRESSETLIPFRWPFFDIDYATLITKPSFFLSVKQRFPDCMLSLHSIWRAKIFVRNVRNRRFKHGGNIELSSVLVRGFEKSDILLSGSLMSSVSPSTEVILSHSLGTYLVFASDLDR